jgi:putative peptidoglycan lipid II flippase
MVGGLTVLRYAQNLASFPLGIVGLSVAISSFSTLSALALADDNKKSFMKHLGEQVANILFFILPASVGLILLGNPIIRLLLQGGNFGADSTTSTAVTLSLLSIGLFATSLIPLIQRAFYALENTRTPLVLSIFSVITNGVLSFVLAQRYGVFGIAIANTFAVILHIILLSVFLRRNTLFIIPNDAMSRENTILVRNSILKMIFLSAVMAGVILGIQNFFPVTHEYSSVLISTSALIVAGALTYLFGAYLLKLPELRRNVLFQKLARIRNANT